MASAERIRLIECPKCGERVIAPPRASLGVWQCPFCRSRFRRRLSSSSSSGTIPCINLFSKHPWQDDPQHRLCVALSFWLSIGLTLYAFILLAIILTFHVCMTVLAVGCATIALPATFLQILVSEPAPEAERRRVSLGTRLVRAWMPYFRPERELGFGVRLLRDEEPGIFAIVAEMSKKVGAQEPDEIRLVHLPCCGVLDQRSWGGFVSQRRTLVLGLPLLYVLSIEELRAVIAHELAHLSRGDAALAYIVSQFLDSLEQSITPGERSSLYWLNPCVPFAWVARLMFRSISSPLNRYQEHRADAIAARVCGSDVLSSSLRGAALVQPVFREVLEYYHPVAVHEANLYQFFLSAWKALGEPRVAEMQEALVGEEKASLFGPHPTLRARLRRVHRFPPHRDPDGRPARRLLIARRRLEEALHDHIYRVRVPQLSVFHPNSEGSREQG